MRVFFYNFFASLFIFLFFVNFANADIKEKYKLVLFYADWNVYSPKAISTLEQVAISSDKISFEQINIDDEKASLRIKELGIMPTNSIPYYFLIDKNQKVIYGSTYKNESYKKILHNLNKKIED